MDKSEEAMSDIKTGEDGEANAGRSKTLSLKRTVESGQVRQSFSHGRSKSVLVEKRRKRTINSGAAEAAPPEDAAPQPAPAVAEYGARQHAAHVLPRLRVLRQRGGAARGGGGPACLCAP